FVEPDLVADAEVVEVGVDDAVAVKIDRTSFRRRDAAGIALREQHLDRAVRRALAGLYPPASDADPVLELAASCVEGIAHRDVDVLMGVVFGRIPARDDHGTRHADVDEHPVELALALPAMRGLDRHAAADDLRHEALELERPLPRRRLDGLRSAEIAKRDLERDLHRFR